MKIEFFSDYACPYCYIGETNLKQALRETGLEDEVELDMKAFELNPHAPKVYTGPTTARFAQKYHLTEEEAAKRIEKISETGRNLGLDFRYKDTRYTNTADAHRLTKYAKDVRPEIVPELEELIFKAYFTDSRELSDHHVLAELAASAGLDQDKVLEMLDGDAYIQDVRNDEMLASLLGVQGVPYFMIGDVHIPGAMPKEALKDILQKEFAKTKPAFETLEGGIACSADGCAMPEESE